MSGAPPVTLTLLAERYRVVATLGQGEIATTYLVEDEREPGVRRVVKRFSARRALGAGAALSVASLNQPDAFKLVELFEREARILSQLQHPRVPRFIDFATREAGDDVEMLLVQEHIPGKTLAEVARGGRHFTEAEVVRMGAEVARTLGDLHALRPPLVHRDVKPSNILLRDGDGALYLIDFGAVKHRVGDVGGGLDEATVVGTWGYMPLEQLEGRATPASDVYALGATLAALLTGKAPNELPRKKLRLDVGAVVPISPPLARVLATALAPNPDERYADGAELADDLDRIARGEAPRLRAVPTTGLAAGPVATRRVSRGVLLLTLAAGVVLAIGGRAVMRAFERRVHTSTVVPEGGPVPFAKKPVPLPLGPPAAPAAPFFTRHEAEGLVMALHEDGNGDVWATLDSKNFAVRFADADPARPNLVPAPKVRAGGQREPALPADVKALLARELPGVEVNAVARGEGDRLWVGTHGDGLHYREGGLWYRMTVAEGLPSDQILAVLIDRRGGLWVAAYPTVLHAKAAEAGDRIKTVPRTGSRGGTVYESAAGAAEKLIGLRQESGDVIWRRSEDHTLVFFEGRLVHPPPPRGRAPEIAGYARSHGHAVMLRHDGSGTLWVDGKPASVPEGPPGRYGGVGVEGAFLDRDGVVWAWGNARLIAFDPKTNTWTDHAEVGRKRVSGAVEDRRGRSWFATSEAPPRSTGGKPDGSLHAFDGTTWTHVNCTGREYAMWPTLAIHALARLRDGRLLLGVTSDHRAGVFDPKDDMLDCDKRVPVGLAHWRQLLEDAEGRFWMIGSGTGLAIREGDKVSVLGARDGFISDGVRAMAFDAEKRLWAQSYDGRVGVYPASSLLQIAAAKAPAP